jgi:hypothetical protein
MRTSSGAELVKLFQAELYTVSYLIPDRCAFKKSVHRPFLISALVLDVGSSSPREERVGLLWDWDNAYSGACTGTEQLS